jgi:serine phosphatase RsbU (regulator of sigma subunit)
MCYSNAVHPRPFHIHREIGIVEPLRFSGLQGPVLGISPAATYPNSYGTASANDLVVLFTDGLFEVETTDDEYYGADRLLAAVRKRMHLSARQLFGEAVAEIQGSCISGQFQRRYVPARSGTVADRARRFEPEGCVTETVVWAVLPGRQRA